MTSLAEPPSGGAASDPPHPRALEWVGWGILLVGALLRIRQYATDRSLWLDEILLAANILDRPLRSLLTAPLDYAQGAPLGFLALERLAVNVGGGSEFVLRLVPFVAALLALPLFLRVARAFLSPPAVVVALALFAFSPSLIFYGAEVKQYGVDVIVLLALFALVGSMRPLGKGRWLALAIGGSLAVWISHPAVFALGAIGVACFPGRGSGRAPLGVGWWVALMGIWAASVGLNYAVHLRHLTANPVLLDYWDRGFPPGRLPTPDAGFWLVRSVLAFFRFPAGSFLPPAGEETYPRMVDLSGVLVFGFVAGGLALWRDRRRWALLVLPIVFVLLAAWLRVFPFQGRVVLFLAPVVFLVVGKGVALMGEKSRPLGITLAALVLLHPVLFAGHGLGSPQLLEETRPLLEIVRDRHRPTDRVYLYYGAIPAHRFYAPRLGMEAIEVIDGVESRAYWQAYGEDLERLRGGGRTWVFFTHVCDWEGVDEERLFRQYLERLGPVVETWRVPGASVSLYHFPTPSEPSLPR